MITLLGTFFAVLLSHLLLNGSRMDQGLAVTVIAPATLGLSMGLGLLLRGQVHVLAYGLALTLLVPLRGPLVESMGALIPGDSAAFLTTLVSLAPVGFVAGRMLSTLTRGSSLALAAGWALGELAVMSGALSVLVGFWSGLLFAVAFAFLAKRMPEPDASEKEGTPWEAMPFGFALGIAWLILRRVAPGYSTPPAHAGSEVLLALLLPALVVAWPASVLATGALGRRLLRAVGFLAIGFALWKLAGSLELYKFSSKYVAVQLEIRQMAARWGGPVTEWRSWLLVYCGLPAASFGLVLGCLGKRACAPFVLGLGLAVAAESWILTETAEGPQQLLIGAAGVAALAALSGWRRVALIAVPAGLGAAALIPPSSVATYEGIRRVGELGVESWHRQQAADVEVFSSGGPDVSAQQARRIYTTTFSDREPLGEVLELRGESWAQGHDHAVDTDPLPSPLLPSLDDEDGDADLNPEELKRYFGVRFAGVAAHPGHNPMGPEGSLGRLHRLLGVPGRSFVTGVGAEFVAADLLDAGLSTSMETSSALPLGLRNQRVVFAMINSQGLGLDVADDPLAALRNALTESYSMVVMAPERAEWPGAGIVSTEGSLERAAQLLAPGGRCLLWLDTASMDAASLRSRLAAFGRVFGERSAAFLEMKELVAPHVLLLGWIDDEGQPRAQELLERLPMPDETGLRTRLWGLEDLGAMLLLDGEGMTQLAASTSAHSRAAPRWPSSFTGRGWEAVLGVVDGSRNLARVIAGSDAPPRDLSIVAEGLAAHGRYVYDLDPLGNAMLVEVLDDVDWAAFDRELALYARAAESDPENPLLHQALAALLGPLARSGDATRFAEAFQTVHAEQMQSWRLAALEAHVRRAGLQTVEAEAALERARQWAPWAETEHGH
ncbi:MAG: hypothetical protein P8N09_12925 [Planctomycetota bacterium]|nr:hypothetical protein [Planctomycetota bacterium]